MMDFGSGGSGAGGNSSPPAFSNLSALAPPFSIGRLNPKRNSNSIAKYSESPCPVDPFSQTWQYTPPSAPRSELIVDSVSMGNPNMLAPDVYQFSASMSTSPSSTHWSEHSRDAKASGTAIDYGGGVQPYYSPYAPTVGKHNPLLDDGPRYDVVPPSGLDLSSQIDYMAGLYDLEYGTGWVDNSGSTYGKRSETVEDDGIFSSEKRNFVGSHSNNNHMNRGHVMESGGKYKQDTGISRELFKPVSERELHTTYTGLRHMEDKLFVEQNLSFLPSDSNKTHTSAANSTYSESHSHGQSADTQRNFSGYQNAFSSYNNPLKSTVPPFTRPAPPIRPSSSVVIRPPPVVNGGSPSTACNENVSAGPVISDFDLTVSSYRKDLGQKSKSEVKEDQKSYDVDLSNLSKQGNSLISVSRSVKEFSTPLKTSECNDKTSCLSQFSNMNVLDGFGNVQVVACAEVSSDSVDCHSLGVDSPCWRGANSSQFSSLYVEDDFSSYYYKKNLDELYGLDHEKQQNTSSATDSMTISVRAGEGNKNQETECAQNSSDDAKAEVRVSARSIGVQMNKDPNMPRKEVGLPNNWKNGFDMNNSNSKHFIGKVDTGLTLSDVSEGNISVHAAEKVLDSPSSQKDTAKGTQLDTAKGTQLRPDPKMDVSMIIKSMWNLSESLLFHLSNDASVLEDKNTESLKLLISNLDSCMSKKIIKPTNEPILNYPIGDTSKIGESHNMGTIPDRPHKTNGTKDSHMDRDYWSMYDEGGNSDDFGKKDEKSPVFSSLRDDSDITTDDGMAKAIKKVLDENFNLDEEMHPQALLFKSLWLDAEAKLCSISYRARFDRMKLQMEKSKPKPPLGSEDVAEMTTKIHISPKAHDDTVAKPAIESSSYPRTNLHPGDVETSVMARFSILKSREDDIKLMNKEEEQKSEIAAADGDSVMARLNILKPRTDNSKLINVEKEKSPEIGSGGQDCLGTCVGDQSEDAAKSEVAPRPHFLHGTGNHSEGNFASGHESLKEGNSSVANDQMIQSFDNGRMINQHYSGWHGSYSSSDWEHVLKDDFAWKNL